MSRSRRVPTPTSRTDAIGSKAEPSTTVPDLAARLAGEWARARRDLFGAADAPARKSAELRGRVLHTIFVLLNHLDSDEAQLERASRASLKTLEALGLRDMYSGSDRRGRVELKTMLRRVMKETLEAHVLSTDESATNGPRRLTIAVARAREQLRSEPEALPPLAGTPNCSTPLSLRLAFSFYVDGLCDDAAVAAFGSVPMDAVDGIAAAVRHYAQGLGPKRTLQLDELCTRALGGAGLLTGKQRSEFFR